ncbi:MAG: glycosyltransferase [Candidatus Methanoperedens sp.]|nr:glycosyltransferase [Candidatus Methanoperedens sp.]
MSLYEIYIKQTRITDHDVDLMREEIKTFKYSPRISIITPVHNVDPIWLEKAIDSVLSQVYENWELCLADDASTKKHIKKILDKYQNSDDRIKVKYLNENQGISGASNEALSLAKGEFIGLLDHDDELSVNALFEVVKLLQDHTDADMVYSDEDKIDLKNRRSDPYFKPDWSPDLFLSSMYTSHFGVYRRKIIEEIGGFRKGFEGSQDYDLVLRFTEKTDKIYHIPKILYHWRKVPNSTAVKYEAKGYADVNARKALGEALQRRKIDGKVLSGMFPGYFRIKRVIMNEPEISIIILSKDSIGQLRKCIESIENKTNYKNYNIIVVSNNDQTLDYIRSTIKSPNIRNMKFEKSFNVSLVNNFAAQNTTSEYLVFLNSDTEVISEEWLFGMLEHAQRKDVGAVGCKLIYPDMTIHHAGIILGLTGIDEKFEIAGYSDRSIPDSVQGYFGRPNIIHNVSAIAKECFMVRRDIFNEVGGFDTDLENIFIDIDFCLKIRKKGYLIVYTPYAKLFYHELIKKVSEKTNMEELSFNNNLKYIREKWGKVIDNGDPYFNSNLTLDKGEFLVRV